VVLDKDARTRISPGPVPPDRTGAWEGPSYQLRDHLIQSSRKVMAPAVQRYESILVGGEARTHMPGGHFSVAMRLLFLEEIAKDVMRVYRGLMYKAPRYPPGTHIRHKKGPPGEDGENGGPSKNPKLPPVPRPRPRLIGGTGAGRCGLPPVQRTADQRLHGGAVEAAPIEARRRVRLDEGPEQ
jgi:hypothetical protein